MSANRIHRSIWIVAVAGAFPFLAAFANAQDLRRQFGTRSTAAATNLNEAIQLVNQKKAADALPLLDKSLAADPSLQLAYYWKALAQIDLGDVDAGIKEYEKIWSLGEAGKITSVTVDACINAGLTLAKLKQLKESTVWFTRAIILDPEDRFDLRWKAFRNMGIARLEAGDQLSAAFSVIGPSCLRGGELAAVRRSEDGDRFSGEGRARRSGPNSRFRRRRAEA